MKSTIRTGSNNADLVDIRRRRISECAAKLFVKQGYDRTTVRQIADCCGMATGTLYHYLGSKDDIIRLIVDEGVSQFEYFFDYTSHAVISNPASLLEQSIDKYYRFVDQIQDLILFLHQEAKNLRKECWQSIVDLEMRVFAVFTKILAKGSEVGDFDIPNIDLTVHTIVIAGQAWAVRRWYLRKHYTIDEYIAAQTTLFLKSISINPYKGIYTKKKL
jgi:TetR/AcrR family transcriptional regulator, cholesterol catabolism regulator